MRNNKKLYVAFRTAFPATVPILAAFLFLGIAYGIFMNVSGFNVIYTFLMSLLIFAGSMEFLTVNLLLGAFHPLSALLFALMVNARHLFYGISMLEKFKGMGLKKLYLIFGLCDESFTINYSAKIPEGVDKGWYMFFVTLLNHCYWVVGACIGGVFGSILHMNMEGLEFVMTALFVVIFIEQWKSGSTSRSALVGVVISILCLIIFGSNSFMIPAMILIIAALTITRKGQEPVGEAA